MKNQYKWSFFIMLLIGIFAITGIHPASAQAKTNRKVTKAYMEKYTAIKKQNQKKKIQASYALVNMKGLKYPILLIKKTQTDGISDCLIFRYQKGKVIKTLPGFFGSPLSLKTDGKYLLLEGVNDDGDGYFTSLYCWSKIIYYHKGQKISGLKKRGSLEGINEENSSYLDTGEFTDDKPNSGILERRTGPSRIKYTQKAVTKALLKKHPRVKKLHLSYSNFKKVKFRTKKMKY